MKLLIYLFAIVNFDTMDFQCDVELTYKYIFRPGIEISGRACIHGYSSKKKKGPCIFNYLNKLIWQILFLFFFLNCA